MQSVAIMRPLPMASQQVPTQDTPLRCVDAGSAYCPCHLADLGECIECSIMRGEDTCHCRWSGTCLLMHSNWQSQQGVRRESRQVPIESIEECQEGVVLVTVTVSPLLAAELRMPGSFVFVRGNGCAHFDTPIAVVRASPATRQVTLAYSVVGPKTKCLRQAEKSLWLRGPYWNGIKGRQYITDAHSKACLLVAGGASAAVLPHVVDTLVRQNNLVTVLLGNPGGIFVKRFLPQQGIRTMEMPCGEEPDFLRMALQKSSPPHLVFCGGGKMMVEAVAALTADFCPDTVFANTVDHNMCCGEGLCGACLDRENGTSVRVCKTLR